MAIIIVVGVTIFNHLREVSTRHMRLKIAGAGAIAAFGIGIGQLGKSASSTNTQTAQYLGQLKPPAMRLVLSKTERVFFANAEKLNDRLDRARTEEQSGELGASSFAFDFDD
jgi:MFS superfamily sulfate permease-like transporter